jgi:hypothetical protein
MVEGLDLKMVKSTKNSEGVSQTQGLPQTLEGKT